ncbi:MAG: AraC family transcriptional regulator [Verrucomicrobiaceae bacterium]|nr:MAG: AraC family transcriptional regulator [Verrucomicrobiaceae bacterium]
MSGKIVIGKRTREIVKGYSPELTGLGLIAAGKTRAYAPYEIVREKLRGGHLIATVDGEGEFLIDGTWRPSVAGTVFIGPPGAAEWFRPVRGKVWEFCWVHTYPEFFETYATPGARLFDADITLFLHAVEGFLHSAYSDDDGKTGGPWVDLIRFYTRRFMGTVSSERHLEKVWAAVAGDPGRAWSIDDLSRLAGMNRELLRVHSRKETGRAPMQQVAHIRLQRAIQILQTCDYKQEVVAELVGYESAFAFSNAMFKVTGHRPSFYRRSE